MIKKVPALKARQNLGQVMNEVALRGDEYIVERAGKPLVAIISMDKYKMLEKKSPKPHLFFITSSGFFRKTCVSGGTDSISHTLPPITERAPITVLPPRIVVLA